MQLISARLILVSIVPIRLYDNSYDLHGQNARSSSRHRGGVAQVSNLCGQRPSRALHRGGK